MLSLALQALTSRHLNHPHLSAGSLVAPVDAAPSLREAVVRFDGGRRRALEPLEEAAAHAPPPPRRTADGPPLRG